MSTQSKNLILVPYDFTERAQAALSHASGIARKAGDVVRIFHVINNESEKKFRGNGSVEDTVSAELEKVADVNYKELGITTEYAYEKGSIFDKIGEFAEKNGARLLVMGTHGVKGIQKLIGAYAMKVVASSPVPIVIVQDRHFPATGYKKIQLAIDAQRSGKNKIIHAIELSKTFETDIILFVEKQSDKFLQNATNNNLAYAQSMFEQNGVEYSIEHQSDSKNFVDGFLRHAGSNGVDCVVICSQQEKHSVADFFFRSEEVALINNQMGIPVMCVNPIFSSKSGNVFEATSLG